MVKLPRRAAQSEHSRSWKRWNPASCIALAAANGVLAEIFGSCDYSQGFGLSRCGPGLADCDAPTGRPPRGTNELPPCGRFGHPCTTHHAPRTTAPLKPCTTRPGGDVLLAGEPRKITDPQPLRGGTAPQPGQRSSLKLSGLIRAHTRRVSGLCGTRVVLDTPDRDTAQWSADSLGRSEVEEVAEAIPTAPTPSATTSR